MSVVPSAPPSLDPVPLSPRARQFYDQVFKPKYENLQQQVQQTPLAILVWGPGAGAGALYQKRLNIRDELRRRGHAAFFSEELEGGAPQGMSLKGIEFLQAQASDLVVVLQTSYGSVAEVHDFASSSVINYKMLIFIREDAKDGYSYKGALSELIALYHNVETFTERDIAECNLMRKVIAKVETMQMVKYRDTANTRAWASLPAN